MKQKIGFKPKSLLDLERYFRRMANQGLDITTTPVGLNLYADWVKMLRTGKTYVETPMKRPYPKYKHAQFKSDLDCSGILTDEIELVPYTEDEIRERLKQ